LVIIVSSYFDTVSSQDKRKVKRTGKPMTSSQLGLSLLIKTENRRKITVK